MKIQDLPQPYRALAEMRREQQIDSEWVKKCDTEFTETNDLNYAFNWFVTEETAGFWSKVYDGNTPEIPAESLAELKEWQNKTMNLQKGQTIWAIDPCETPSGKKHLTVGKAYEIIEATKMDVCVYVDTEQELFFLMDRFYTYFSLTPPYEPVLIAEQPKEMETQFGISATCDFVENTWTFEMPEGFKVSAGEFAIIPKSEYDLINEGKKRNLL